VAGQGPSARSVQIDLLWVRQGLQWHPDFENPSRVVRLPYTYNLTGARPQLVTWLIPDGSVLDNLPAPQPSTLRILNLSEILTLPDPTPLVEDVIMEGENLVLFGPPKKGKSLFALDLGLSIAAGVAVIGKLKVYRPGPVVYLSSEGETYFKQRVGAWLHARALERRDIPFHYVAEVPRAADGPEGLAKYVDLIWEAVGDRRPSLIILDTMSRALGGLDENAASSMNRYEEMTRQIMEEFRCSCLTIAHVGKDSSKKIRGNKCCARKL